MARRKVQALLVVISLLAASCRVIEKQSGSTDAAPETHLLRLKPLDKPIEFSMSQQVEGTSAKGLAYGLSAKVVLVPDASGRTVHYRIEDLTTESSSSETAAVLKVLSGLNLEMSQQFDPQGPLTLPNVKFFDESNWLAAAVAKALGSEDMGFTGMRFPDRPVSVREAWRGSFDRAALLEQEIKRVGGTDIRIEPLKGEVAFTLSQIEGPAAKITYRAESSLSCAYKSQGTERKLREEVTDEGFVWVDLKTGWPIRAGSSRSEKRDRDGMAHETNSTTHLSRTED